MEVQVNDNIIPHGEMSDLERNRKISFAKVTSNTPKTLDELISVLRQVFDKNDVNVDVVNELMNNYKSNPSEWQKYANFDPHR